MKGATSGPALLPVELGSVSQPLLPHTGMGRLCVLEEPVALATVVERVKSHLKLAHVRLALGAGRSLGECGSPSGECGSPSTVSFRQGGGVQGGG